VKFLWRPLGVSLYRKDQFWYPVSDTKAFKHGDVIWVDRIPIGWYEVRGLGRGEVLVRRIPWWDYLGRRLQKAWFRFTKGGADSL